MRERAPVPLAALSLALAAALVVLVALAVGTAMGGSSLAEDEARLRDAVSVSQHMATSDARMQLLIALAAQTGEASWGASFEDEATRGERDLNELVASGLLEHPTETRDAWVKRVELDRSVLAKRDRNVAEGARLDDERVRALAAWDVELSALRRDLAERSQALSKRAERLAVGIVIAAALTVVLVAGALLLLLQVMRRWDSLAGGQARTEVDDARRRLLVDLVDVGSFEADMLNHTLELSSAAARLLGVEPSGPAMEWEDAMVRVVPPDRDALLGALMQRAQTTRSRRVSWRIRVQDDDHSLRTAEVQARVLVDEAGFPYRALGLLRDVTSVVALDQARAAWTAALEAQVAVRTAEAEQRARQAKELAQELAQAEHRARQRVARVLHDGVQQTLVACRLRLSMLARSRDPEPIRKELDQLLAEAIEDARTLSAELDPPVDPDEALGPALDWLAARMGKRHALRVRVAGQGLSERLPPQHGVALLQAARELLFNVVKHAGTDEAEISVRVGGGTRRLEVRDHGQGLGDSVVSGVGLAHTARRLEALGGGLEVVAAEGGGCIATAWLPMGPVGLVPGPLNTETPLPPLPPSRVRRDRR